MSEKAVKALQKEVLDTFETQLLEIMSTEHFNELRKLVFRSTFSAYRLGFLGLQKDETSLDKLLITAVTVLRDLPTSILGELDTDLQQQLLEYCLLVWLEAFRIGAIASRRDS
jgi:hypothetical protein